MKFTYYKAFEDAANQVRAEREKLNIELGIIPKVRTKIRVFPDYCSSGLWRFPPDHRNLDESEVCDVIPEVIMIALKHWHHVWELTSYYMGEDDTTSMSVEYRKKWEEDGQKIVDAMNSCQNKFEFIYIPSFEESEK